MTEGRYSMSHLNQKLIHGFQHEDNEDIKFSTLVDEYDEKINANAMQIDFQYELKHLWGDPLLQKNHDLGTYDALEFAIYATTNDLQVTTPQRHSVICQIFLIGETTEDSLPSIFLTSLSVTSEYIRSFSRRSQQCNAPKS